MSKIKNAMQESSKGFNFRSRLELYTFDKLVENNIPFKYEKYRFKIIPSFSYEGFCVERKSRKENGKRVNEFIQSRPLIRPITYTPDFGLIDLKKRTGWVIETKGFKTETFNLKFKLFKFFLKTYNYKLDIYMPSNQNEVNLTIDLIKQRNG